MQANRKQQGGPANEPEATLFQHAQGGCRQSLNLLMSHHEGLVHAVMHEQYLYGLPYEEALQAGRSALWRAIMGYEPQRGTTFSTYAWVIIMRAVWLEVKRMQKDKAWVVLEENWEDESQEAGREQQRVELREMMMDMVSQLPERQQRIVYERYGWGGRGAVHLSGNRGGHGDEQTTCASTAPGSAPALTAAGDELWVAEFMRATQCQRL